MNTKQNTKAELAEAVYQGAIREWNYGKPQADPSPLPWDAKLIVASVNQAAQLAEALRAIVQWLDVDCDPSRKSLEDAKAALNAWDDAQDQRPGHEST